MTNLFTVRRALFLVAFPKVFTWIYFERSKRWKQEK